MNGRNLNPPIISHTQNIVYDDSGSAVLSLGMHVYTVTKPDGQTVTYKISENLQLCDGHVWNGAQMAAGLFLAVCEDCRHPRVSLLRLRFEKPSHGLCLAANIKRCICGRPTCGQHRILGSDNHWRCLACQKRYLLNKAITFIFFKRS